MEKRRRARAREEREQLLVQIEKQKKQIFKLEAINGCLKQDLPGPWLQIIDKIGRGELSIQTIAQQRGCAEQVAPTPHFYFNTEQSGGGVAAPRSQYSMYI